MLWLLGSRHDVVSPIALTRVLVFSLLFVALETVVFFSICVALLLAGHVLRLGFCKFWGKRQVVLKMVAVLLKTTNNSLPPRLLFLLAAWSTFSWTAFFKKNVQTFMYEMCMNYSR